MKIKLVVRLRRSEINRPRYNEQTQKTQEMQTEKSFAEETMTIMRPALTHYHPCIAASQLAALLEFFALVKTSYILQRQ